MACSQSSKFFFFFSGFAQAGIHTFNTLNMGKEKKEKKVKQSAGSDNEEESRVLEISPIAHPLAEKKLTKKLLKTVKKGSHFSCFLNDHNRAFYFDPQPCYTVRLIFILCVHLY